MDEWIGKSCVLTVELDGRKLFYTVKLVTDVSGSHISFIDKYDERLSVRLSNVVTIAEAKE